MTKPDVCPHCGSKLVEYDTILKVYYCLDCDETIETKEA